jgi:hypothetical protein
MALVDFGYRRLAASSGFDGNVVFATTSVHLDLVVVRLVRTRAIIERTQVVADSPPPG